MVPGEVLQPDEDIEINPGRRVVTVRVVNTGDRPIQVGSHFHFAEVNRALHFDRHAAWGTRLALPSGTSMRFEPAVERDVELVELAGNRRIPGLRGAVRGPIDEDGRVPSHQAITAKLRTAGVLDDPEERGT